MVTSRNRDNSHKLIEKYTSIFEPQRKLVRASGSRIAESTSQSSQSDFRSPVVVPGKGQKLLVY
jgi:hypothetical protein